MLAIEILESRQCHRESINEEKKTLPWPALVQYTVDEVGQLAQPGRPPLDVSRMPSTLTRKPATTSGPWFVSILVIKVEGVLET